MSTLCVRNLMTSDVFTVNAEDSLATARDLMDEKHIRHVPVVDEGGVLAGLISERDLLRRASGGDAELPLSVREDVFTDVRVREVMTWDVETAEADDNIVTAAQTMLENKYGACPLAMETPWSVF